MTLPSAPTGRVRPFLARTFAALEHRDYRLFAGGQAISLIGNWMQQVAIGWLVLLLTGSPLLLGLVAGARALPVLLLGFVGGMVADRYDRRRLLIASNVAGGALSTLLAVLTLTDLVTVPLIIAIALLLGTSMAFEIPTRQSFVVALSGREHMANAIALNSLMFNLARVLGPALAGIIVAIAGPGPAFALNALTYLPVIVSLLLIRTSDAGRERSRMRGALGETFAYLRTEPRVVLILVLLMANTVFASGHIFLGPAIARDLGQDADGFGLLLSAVGIGAILGGFVLAMGAASTARRARALFTACVVLGAAEIGVALSGVYPLTLILFGVLGFGWVTINATTNTLLQSLVRETFRGRVMALYVLVMMGFQPFGGLLLGALGDAWTSATAIGIGGTLWLVAAVAVFALRPELRAL